MMERQQPRTYGLHVAVEFDETSGTFVAHCLTLDLMDCGKTPESAWQRLKGVIKAQVEYCYTHNKQGLDRSASQEDWDRYFESIQKNPGSVKVEQIQIELRPPMPEREIPLWIQLSNVNEHEAPIV